MGKQRTTFQQSELDVAINNVMQELRPEIVLGMTRYPDPSLLAAALVEGVGDLHKAMLMSAPYDVRRRALQVAAMAVRVAVEGDPAFDVLRLERGLELLAPPSKYREREFDALLVRADVPF